MRVSDTDQDNLSKMIEIMDRLRAMRGDDQVARMRQISEVFWSSGGLFDLAARGFDHMIDLDQCDRDEALAVFTNGLRNGRN
jgi:hypothetical protein